MVKKGIPGHFMPEKVFNLKDTDDPILMAKQAGFLSATKIIRKNPITF